MTTQRDTLVFGPAYLDRVVLVDRPLLANGVLDRSAMGRWNLQNDSKIVAIEGLTTGTIELEFGDDWPGHRGSLIVGDVSSTESPHRVRCLSWHDDLGGMGAGYAKAFGARLRLLVGDESDAINTGILARLAAEGIVTEPVVQPGRMGEWTLMITSGPHGDKLPIGFRDLSCEPRSLGKADDCCDLLIVASMTNERAAAALAETGANVKMFAPAMRNMLDRSPSVLEMARHIDILCCNRTEWENLEDREEIAWRVSLLAITDGPNGASLRYLRPNGDAGRLTVPAFPRMRPPRDTNRAGEAFASTLVSTLLENDWAVETTEPDLLEYAARRASAAAALVLDRVDFGFPSAEEIDAAIDAGVIK